MPIMPSISATLAAMAISDHRERHLFRRSDRAMFCRLRTSPGRVRIDLGDRAPDRRDHAGRGRRGAHDEGHDADVRTDQRLRRDVGSAGDGHRHVQLAGRRGLGERIRQRYFRQRPRRSATPACRTASWGGIDA